MALHNHPLPQDFYAGGRRVSDVYSSQRGYTSQTNYTSLRGHSYGRDVPPSGRDHPESQTGFSAYHGEDTRTVDPAQLSIRPPTRVEQAQFTSTRTNSTAHAYNDTTYGRDDQYPYSHQNHSSESPATSPTSSQSSQ